MKTSGVDSTERTNFFVGTSGWNYPHWRKIIYPDNLKTSEWLSFYSSYFQTTEVNVTFYRDVRKSTFERWFTQVGDNFLFSVKMPRIITHYKRLNSDKGTITKFLHSISPLKEKLGAILIQLPPSLKFDRELFKRFFELLDFRYRYAIEVRNKTFFDESFLNILKTYNIALCIADSAKRYPYFEDITADFIYVRLHGSERLYASEYSEEELNTWAQKIQKWNRPSFIYFNNDLSGYAFKNALRLKELLTFLRGKDWTDLSC